MDDDFQTGLPNQDKNTHEEFSSLNQWRRPFLYFEEKMSLITISTCIRAVILC